MSGHLDKLLTSGHIEGWALDTDAPGRPVRVTVTWGEAVVARGTACRFRADLAEAGIGWGWSAFRLPFLAWPPFPPEQPVLALFGGGELLWRGQVDWIESVRHRYVRVGDLIAQDPTVIRDPAELVGLRDHLAQLCRQLGAPFFVQRCYLAIFGRAADASGLAGYCDGLVSGRLQALDVVTALMDSVEFRASGRGIPIPILPSFPFASVGE